MSWGWDHILANPAHFSPCVSHIFLLPLVLLSLIPTYLGAKDVFFASKITSEIHPYNGIYEFIDLEVCMWIHTFKQNWMKIYEFIHQKVWIHRIIVRNQWFHTPRRPLNSYFWMYEFIYFHLTFFVFYELIDSGMTEIYEFIDSFVTILIQQWQKSMNS
jgi:hypothetical protein